MQITESVPNQSFITRPLFELPIDIPCQPADILTYVPDIVAVVEDCRAAFPFNEEECDALGVNMLTAAANVMTFVNAKFSGIVSLDVAAAGNSYGMHDSDLSVTWDADSSTSDFAVHVSEGKSFWGWVPVKEGKFLKVSGVPLPLVEGDISCAATAMVVAAGEVRTGDMDLKLSADLSVLCNGLSHTDAATNKTTSLVRAGVTMTVVTSGVKVPVY